MADASNSMIPLSQLKAQPLSWLWPGRLPLGKLAMFDGDPGRAKSLVTLDLCARLSTGRPMPDGAGGREPTNCVIIQGEDFTQDTVLPRLHALGANLDRIFVFRPDYLEQRGPFRLCGNDDILEEAITPIAPRLLIIDPIMAFLNRDILGNDDQSIRRAMSPLAEWADKNGCAVILVRHMNKSGRPRSIYRGLGSIGFNAACRSSWLFDRDPDDESRLIMAQIKNNNAPLQPSLAFRIFSPVPNQPPTLEWLGSSEWTADQLLSGPGRKHSLFPRDRAREFLPRFLKGGPRTTGEIWKAADDEGLHHRILQNQRDDLDIRSCRVWNGQKLLTYWLLPGQKLPDSIPPEHRPDDLDDLFASQREKYPVTPLDNNDP
jgi:hypothetical protein